MAPALILAYAVGRIGCQVSGDGDWGILNSAYVTTPALEVKPASNAEFQQALNTHQAFYSRHVRVDTTNTIPHKSFPAPSWMPEWMVAYHYPNNVISEGVKIPGCEDQYCSYLPIPVFPTAFYETVICLVLFGILWALRKRMLIPGTLFAVYLVLNGLERFFIEKIRVNTKYSILGFHPTQAELIAASLIIIGAALYFFLRSSRFSPEGVRK
jgi:prolipoprotein diacylglyceryltransferase